MVNKEIAEELTQSKKAYKAVKRKFSQPPKPKAKRTLITLDNDSEKTSSLPPPVKRPRTTNNKHVSTPRKLTSFLVEKVSDKNKETKSNQTDPRNTKADTKTDTVKATDKKDFSKL